MNRWTYPIVPELFSVNFKPASHKRNQIYLADDVILSRFTIIRLVCVDELMFMPARGCTLEFNVIIGQGTKVGNDNGATSFITNSVIGRNCMIGSKCAI